MNFIKQRFSLLSSVLLVVLANALYALTIKLFVLPSGMMSSGTTGILHSVDRGVTLLHGEGGYARQSAQVILSIVSNRELPQVLAIARRIDPESFVIVSRVSEVRGRGFSISKIHS